MSDMAGSAARWRSSAAGNCRDTRRVVRPPAVRCGKIFAIAIDSALKQRKGREISDC